MYKDILFLLNELNKIDDYTSHIIITGKIKSGKTYLLNKYIEKFYSNYKKEGIVTTLVKEPNPWISFKYLNCNEVYEIAYKKNNSMIFNSSLFIKLSCDFFNNIPNDTNLIIMDEIGYNEINLNEYIDKLIETFNRFRVICVVRKDKNALNSNMDKIGKYKLFDLDKF